MYPDISQKSNASSEDAAISALLARVYGRMRQRLVERGLTGEELEDVQSDAVQRLLVAARRGPRDSGPRFENELAYALRVAESAFDDHLRRSRPNWCRLKRRILYLLDGPNGAVLFARWRWEQEWLGGFARWRGQGVRSTARYRDFCARSERFCCEALADRSAEQVPLPELLARLFHWLATPLELDELTGHVASLQQVKDRDNLSLQAMQEAGDHLEGNLVAHTADLAEQVVLALAGENFCAAFWQTIGELPLRQRMALLLGMEREELLLLTTVTGLADALSLSREAVVPLWLDLPLPDARIAPLLEATPKQVANLRKCARERLARWFVRLRRTENAENREPMEKNP